MTSYLFSNDELNFISDKAFFEKKAAINNKVIEHLNMLQQRVNILLKANTDWLPENVLHSSPKISRGENYKGFPWLVLDYPRVFSNEEVFAFRTLFWWSHSWVLTFQLSGSFFKQFYSSIRANLNSFMDVSCKIGIGKDPWIHNPEDVMYVDLQKFISAESPFDEVIHDQPFFKLIKKIEFGKSEKLMEEAIAFYSNCLRLIKS